jgi:quinoprotein glucose dehydrogenase
MAFGPPTSTYYGADRKGDNLFGNAVVAIDAVTGKFKWHFQAVHHDVWDFDLPPAPTLIDIVRAGTWCMAALARSPTRCRQSAILA